VLQTINIPKTVVESAGQTYGAGAAAAVGAVALAGASVAGARQTDGLARLGTCTLAIKVFPASRLDSGRAAAAAPPTKTKHTHQGDMIG
jgi:hypothetical protein